MLWVESMAFLSHLRDLQSLLRQDHHHQVRLRHNESAKRDRTLTLLTHWIPWHQTIRKDMAASPSGLPKQLRSPISRYRQLLNVLRRILQSPVSRKRRMAGTETRKKKTTTTANMTRKRSDDLSN